jgi:hypothetical protein
VNIDQPTLSNIQAAQAQAGTTVPGVPPATPNPTAGTTGAAATAGVVPQAPGGRPVTRDVGPPAPTYADPRLAGSGTVRDEYRNSGSAIPR